MQKVHCSPGEWSAIVTPPRRLSVPCSRITGPTAGVMISSTTLTLAAIPAVCPLVEEWRLRGRPRTGTR
jgi:hypothetical protein